MNEPRPLTPDERAVLHAAVDVDPRVAEVADALHAQVEQAVALGRSCTCGCPSYALAVPDDAPRAAVPEFGADVDGGDFRITLVDGHLDDVEISWYSDEPPTRWPDADDLR